jgi:1-phosphofructokinase
MIVTVTPNPSIDRSLQVDSLEVGEVVRARRSWSEPSGKGVNVALALHHQGLASLAVLPVGGATGAQLVAMLRAAAVPFEAVPIAGEVRVNVSLVQPDGVVTKVNEPGPELTAAEGVSVIEAATAAAAASPGHWLAGCGSLPRGIGRDFYARLVEAGHRVGARVVVDSSGPALDGALAAGPDLVKPNVGELEELVGTPIRTLGDVVEAAEQVRRRGALAVLASLGADGVVLVDAGGARFGEARVSSVRSPVGAGDALLAGFLSVGADAPGQVALARALLWASSAVRLEGTVLRSVEADLPVRLHERLPSGRRLSYDEEGS